MLNYIKSRLYSVLLFIGAIVYKNHFSKVIYYHDIHKSEVDKFTEMSTSIHLFIEQLNIIKSLGFEVVNEITEAYSQIQISFDDGFRGVYENKDFLINQDVFPTIYIITSKVGSSGYLTWQEIVELKRCGFNIQSHTHTHSNLNELNKQELYDELYGSKKLLEHYLNEQIVEICFPKGLFNDKVLEMCEQVGYKKWFCSIPANYIECGNRSQLKFRNLVQSSGSFDFKCILLGGMRIFRNRYSKKHYGKKIHIS